MVFERRGPDGEHISGWWFRDKKDLLKGPFKTRIAAEFSYEQDQKPGTRDGAMNYPVYEASDGWWFRDDEFDMNYGPYATRDEAIEAYEEHMDEHLEANA